MSSVAVERVREPAALPRRLFEEMESIAEKIRAKAYELYLERGGEPNRALEDWLLAERQLMPLPETEIGEVEREFQIRANVPGLDAKDLRVIAMPHAILVQGEPKSRESKFFLRLDLPSPIDPDRVTARLEKGTLQLDAPKSREGAIAA